MSANVYLHAHFCGSWSVDVSNHRKMPFHVIGAGRCWLHMHGERPPVALAAGDLVVFPHDSPHLLAPSAVPPGPSVPRNRPASEKPSDDSFTTLVCGDFDIERRFWNPLLDALPDVILARRDDPANTLHLGVLLDLIVAESSSPEPGGKALVDKLGETLFVHAVRTHLRQDVAHAVGYTAALADRHVGKALMAIHEQPGYKWTVDSLARRAGQSRSAFAERFGRLVGTPPMQYLTLWRMRQAHEWLATGGESVAQVAARCGYESEAAFSRVFKSHLGVGPGAVRRRANGYPSTSSLEW